MKNLFEKLLLTNHLLMLWSKFGPKPDIFLIEFQKEIESFIQFYSHQLRGTNQPEGKLSLMTMATFGLPWIWRWNVQYENNEMGLPILLRICMQMMAWHRGRKIYSRNKIKKPRTKGPNEAKGEIGK